MTLQEAIRRTAELMLPEKNNATEAQTIECAMRRLILIDSIVDHIMSEAEVNSYLDIGSDVPGGGAA